MLCCLMLCETRAQAASLGKEIQLDKGEKTISCDVTGNGKKDTVKLRAASRDGYFLDKAYVYVNGKKSLTLNVKGCNGVSFRHISCTKKKNYLQIEARADGGYMFLNKIYKYSGGKLIKAADLGRADNMSATVTKVTASSIQVLFSVQPAETGRLEWTFTYKPNGNKLKTKSKTVSVKSTLGQGTDWQKDGYFKYFKKNQFVTLTGRKYYTSSNLKKTAFTAKKGDVVTLKKVKISGKKMYLCFKKGKKSGWIRIKDKYSTSGWYYGVNNRLAG